MKPNPLKKHLEVLKVKPTPWAVSKKISPAVVSRYFRTGAISPENAQKISRATGNKVTFAEISLWGLKKKQSVKDSN